MRKHMKEQAGPVGIIDLMLQEPGGRIVEHVRCRNLITTVGKSWLAGRAAGSIGLSNMTDIAVGTGSTAPALDDTGLENQLAKVSLSEAPWQGSGSDANKMFARAIFDTSEAVGTLSEAGLFFGGSLFSRVLISPAITKDSQHLLIVQWSISF